MKIERLKLFTDLYETGSYTKTARQNYISQTSVTQFINSLEAELGVKLLDRSTIPVKPTSAGKVFYQEAVKLISEYEHIQERVKNNAENITESVNIGFTSRVDIHFLLPVLKSFLEQYSNVHLNVSKVKFKNALEEVRKGNLDIVLGIDFNVSDKENIELETVYQGKYVALVGSEHTLYHNSSITNEELYHYPLIMLSQESIGSSFDAMVKKSNEDGFYPNIVKTVDDIETELFSILSDNLIGFAPDNFALNEFGEFIKKIPIVGSSHGFELALAYQGEDKASVSLFVTMLKDYLKTQ